MKFLVRESDCVEHRLRILHFEDSALDAELVERAFHAGEIGVEIALAKNGPEFRKALDVGQFDLILSDYSVPRFDGLSALKLAHCQHADIPFIFVSGTIGEEKAVEALKQGATDYVPKDRLTRLVPVVLRAVRDAEAARSRRAAEERIREQAEVLDQAQDAICIIDMSQRVLYWNQGAERLYGWKAGVARGQNAIELLFAPDSTNPITALRNMIRPGFWRGELEQVTREGKTVIVESRWTLMRDEHGAPKSILIINTDVTERKRIENQLQRTQRMECIGALAGGIAHDLNNSLAPILMAADLLRDDLATDGSKQLLGMIKGSARRSVELVQQILSFARGSGGERQLLDVQALITEVLKLAVETFPRSIQIQSRFASGLHGVKGNPTQLNQVLLNLCINARDAMPNGGSISIEATNVVLDQAEALKRHRSPGPYLLVTVTDTGQGMSAEVLDKMFEPFFTTKSASQGTGLGLSIVMGIVKAHDGFIQVSSRLQHGTTFIIYLPASPISDSEGTEEYPARSCTGNGERILLVDDEIAILEVTKLLLESVNYEVTTAPNGNQALELYRQQPSEIDVVITDLMMPSMNGVELILKLRQINPSAKIIAVSGMSPETPLTQSAKNLTNLLLKKPFATHELVTALRNVLDNEDRLSAQKPHAAVPVGFRSSGPSIREAAGKR